jgi:hypothetical protein
MPLALNALGPRALDLEMASGRTRHTSLASNARRALPPLVLAGGRRLGYRRGECQKGATQKPRWRVRIGNSLNDRARFASLIHEIAHIYLGHLGDNPNKWPDRRPTRIDVREFEAEAVSFIVGRRFGLQTASADYLRGYIKQDTIAYVSFSAIARAAGRIEQHAR